jgi:hypothetical protein
MRPRHALALAAIALGMTGIPAISAAQTAPASTQSASPYTYVDLADLASAAPINIHGAIRSATQIKADRAPGLAAGHARFLVEADILSLIRGVGPMAPKVQYLVDLPLTEAGKPPKLRRKQPVLLFAHPIAGERSGSFSTNQIRLAAPDAQLAWDPATDSMLRSILAELVQRDAPPAITGIANGFHVAGTLPGEGETQLFLDTATGEPVSLTINTLADGTRRWSAAFGEIVDGNAAVPARYTLGWYRLACGLPRQLPMAKLAGTAPDDRRKASADYALILRELGPCNRTRAVPPAL